VQDYVRPDSLSQAVALLASSSFRPLAGGTDVYPGAGTQLGGRVLDLTAIAGLRGIKTEQGLQGHGLRIGAATTWTMLAQANLPPACHALQQAALHVGGRQIQNAGTIGGNLCNASPAADGVPPLLALDAEVELASHTGTRVLPLAAFLLGPRQTALRPDELMTAVLIPEAALSGRSTFLKLGARTHLVISIAMVAVRLAHDGAHLTSAAIAVGSCSGVAQRLPLVERALLGAPLSGLTDRIRPQDIAAALSPIDDIRATASYRIKAATELVTRAVQGAAA
jgi:CO/xanthine dehydrogenase FAD-binding subunit